MQLSYKASIIFLYKYLANYIISIAVPKSKPYAILFRSCRGTARANNPPHPEADQLRLSHRRQNKRILSLVFWKYTFFSGHPIVFVLSTYYIFMHLSPSLLKELLLIFVTFFWTCVTRKKKS